MKKVSIIATTSGNGKTTIGRELARRLGVPFVELDALVHGPSWTETPDDELREQVSRIVAGEGWVIDGTYFRKIGDLVIRDADLVVWLDLPIRVWFPRLVRRTWRRWRGDEELWNGNKESVKDALWGRESLFAWAFRQHWSRGRQWPVDLTRFPVVRLQTQRAVDEFVASVR